MSGKGLSSNEVSVDEQPLKRTEGAGVDKDGFDIVDDCPEFQATVQQEKQAKVDSNHSDVIVQDHSHLLLTREEKIRVPGSRAGAYLRLDGPRDAAGWTQRTREVVTEMWARKRENVRLRGRIRVNTALGVRSRR